MGPGNHSRILQWNSTLLKIELIIATGSGITAENFTHISSSASSLWLFYPLCVVYVSGVRKHNNPNCSFISVHCSESYEWRYHAKYRSFARIMTFRQLYLLSITFNFPELYDVVPSTHIATHWVTLKYIGEPTSHFAIYKRISPKRTLKMGPRQYIAHILYLAFLRQASTSCIYPFIERYTPFSIFFWNEFWSYTLQ